MNGTIFGKRTWAALALGFGLAGHRPLHFYREVDLFDFDVGDFDAPAFRLGIKDLLQAVIDRLARREQLVELDLAEHGT